MAQVVTRYAGSLEGAGEEAGRASAGFQECWSPFACPGVSAT